LHHHGGWLGPCKLWLHLLLVEGEARLLHVCHACPLLLQLLLLQQLMLLLLLLLLQLLLLLLLVTELPLQLHRLLQLLLLVLLWQRQAHMLLGIQHAWHHPWRHGLRLHLLLGQHGVPCCCHHSSRCYIEARLREGGQASAWCHDCALAGLPGHGCRRLHAAGLILLLLWLLQRPRWYSPLRQLLL
jgi:hypothetical protein